MDSPNNSSLDLAATAARALVLYSLMEFQSGNATTIKVTAEGSSFSISDDGRGHPLDKSVGGTSYIRFIYTHFDYPFEDECRHMRFKAWLQAIVQAHPSIKLHFDGRELKGRPKIDP